MAKQRKVRLIEHLQQATRNFDDTLVGKFLCPACLRPIPANDQRCISEAHIIPKAAGGRITTLLCKHCNSKFGHTQDKWFGEYMNVQRSGNLLRVRHQTGHFMLDDVRVGGRYEVAADGGLEVLIWRDRSDPKELRKLEANIAAQGIKEWAFRVPLLANRSLVKVGVLTAAYLLWFRELGYSWALQRHLDPIRHAIQNPESTQLATSLSVRCSDRHFEHPWIGVGYVGEMIVLLAGMADYLAFLPPAGSSKFFAELPDRISGRSLLRDCTSIGCGFDHGSLVPMGVIFHDQPIVHPDMPRRREIPFLYFPPDGGPSSMLYPITKEQFEEQRRRMPEAHVVKVGLGKT